MLKQDLTALRRVTTRRVWTAAAVEEAHHHVWAATGPWLGLARSRRSHTDSPADRARWDAWISALTPPERSGTRSYTDVCVLAGRARDMLRALRQALPPCPPVGSVAAEIERRIRSGDLPPGVRVGRASLAKGLHVPGEHVDLALADLAARGLVEVSAGGRAVVTSRTLGSGHRTGGYGRQAVTVGGAGAGAA
ncbi:GntR family transcriptional regulator [Streptomyces sp. NPDC006339]|uniref:GntR family transcriptional regulator n=1 Tax=Streptomyces sp. NPDC006339 TaxID=3156755 RepID=UPI0033B206EC